MIDAASASAADAIPAAVAVAVEVFASPTGAGEMGCADVVFGTHPVIATRAATVAAVGSKAVIRMDVDGKDRDSEAVSAARR